jgi:hypothetical protein
VYLFFFELASLGIFPRGDKIGGRKRKATPLSSECNNKKWKLVEIGSNLVIDMP